MAESEFEKSRIERLKQEMERPDMPAPHIEVGTLTPHQTNIQSDWNTEPSAVGGKKKRYLEVSIFKVFLFICIAFFITSISFLIYKIVTDPDSRPSEKNVSLNIDGPVSVAAGEEAKFGVTLTNKNTISIDYASLTIIFPDGAQQVSDISKPLKDEKKNLGVVAANTNSVYNTRAVFLGEANTDKVVRAKLEYRLEGMNSSFVKEEEFKVRLTAAPLNVVVEALKEVNAGQEYVLTIKLDSNTRETLADVLVKIEYPFGFTFTSASPKPSFAQNVWKIGTVPAGSKKELTIRGSLQGEDGQEKVFRIYAGAEGRQEYDVGVVYGSLLSAVKLKRPFISTTLEIDGDSADVHVTNIGEKIVGRVSWKNNLATRITNAEIEVQPTGSSLNRKSISPLDGGYYRSSPFDAIVWTERETKPLALIDAGGEGSVQFSFEPLPAIYNGILLRNPEINIEVSIKGKRTSESGVPEEINTTVTKKIKFNTDIQFAASALHTIGPIKNTGPIPPRVDEETTYTIQWSLVNLSNNAGGVTVRSKIPTYVHFVNNIYPDGEDVAYDETSGSVVWNVGDLPAGTGKVTPVKQVAFQVAITPSLGQLGINPTLLFESILSAKDTFTGTEITRTSPMLSTQAGTDPGVPERGGNVIE